MCAFSTLSVNYVQAMVISTYVFLRKRFFYELTIYSRNNFVPENAEDKSGILFDRRNRLSRRKTCPTCCCWQSFGSEVQKRLDCGCRNKPKKIKSFASLDIVYLVVYFNNLMRQIYLVKIVNNVLIVMSKSHTRK